VDVKKVIPTVNQNNEKGEGDSQSGDTWLHPEVNEEVVFDKKIKEIIRLIAEKTDFPSVNNFYKDSLLRRTNLAKYFRALFWIKPRIMFIGEAPGINGCALTGVPFSSERLIQEGRLDFHLKQKFVAEGNSYEGSAAYFWEMIDLMPKPPVLWNVFPLHPYKVKDGDMKNRAPKMAEKEWGRKILLMVLDLFPEIKVISVGNHAKEMCEKLGIETAAHIIHPAYHVSEFREQFRNKILM
jgi:hypothetical protein